MGLQLCPRVVWVVSYDICTVRRRRVKTLVIVMFSIVLCFCGRPYANAYGVPCSSAPPASFFGLATNWTCYGSVDFYSGDFGGPPFNSYCYNSSASFVWAGGYDCFGIQETYNGGWAATGSGPGMTLKLYEWNGGRLENYVYIIYGPPPVQNLYDYHTGTLCGTISNGSTNPSAIQSWNYSNPNCFSSSPP